MMRMGRIFAQSEEWENIARPRLPIGCFFPMTGFGTVVSGTLLDGVFKTGQEVEVQPQGLKTRIRSLQMHGRTIEVTTPGNRVAMNLVNVARSELERGNVVTLPGQLQRTMLIDARIQLLADVTRPLGHNTLIDFYSGSQEVPAKVRLLDVEELKPGQSAWAQVRLSRPAVVARRDRFILRIPSPSSTIGGGEVIDVHPRYHRRFQQPVLTALETLERGSLDELVLSALDRRRETVRAGAKSLHGLVGYELAEITKQSNLSQDVTLQTLETLLSEGRVRKIGMFWFAQTVWETLKEESVRLVIEKHRQHPLRSGLSKEELSTRLNLPPN